MMNSDDCQSTDKSRLRGLQLLTLVKNKKQTEAIQLLDEKPDLNCKDKAGWTALHYAAAGGYTDLVVKLINNGAKVNRCDKNKETALHKAARHGQILPIVILVAHGSKIGKIDKCGQTPLEHAVKSRNIDVIKTLFSFGAEPMLQDWTWTMDDLDKKGNEVLVLLIEQHSRMPGFKYGAINQKLMCVSSGNDVNIDKMRSTIKTNNFSQPYYVQFCKMHSEYSEIMDKLGEEQDVFSDTYEITIWYSCQQTVTMELAISGVCHCNEKLHIVTLEGNPANILKVEKIIEETQDKSYTEVNIVVDLVERKKVRFCIVKQQTPEVFSISEEPVTIIPQMEPDTEIQIPKGTFEEPGEMSVNIVETQEVNREEEQGNGMLLTNVLDLTISNSQQPKEPIRVAIPMHEDTNSTYDLVVLSSKCDQPEVIEDWEVKEAHTDQDRKSAFFYIDHFSFYSVVARKKAEKNLTDVVDALERSLNRKKRVVFFLMTKWSHKDSSEMIVECAGIRHVDQRVQIWIENGYDRSSLQKSDVYHAQLGQEFKFQLHGNLTETSGDKMQSIKFQNNRNNFHVFTLGVNSINLPSCGRLEVLQEKIEDVPKTVPVVKPKTFWCASEEPNIKTPSATSILESILELNIKFDGKTDDVENDEEDDEEQDLHNEFEKDESNHLRQSNETNHSKLVNLQQTIFKRGKPINVLAIKTKKKGYIR